MTQSSSSSSASKQFIGRNRFKNFRTGKRKKRKSCARQIWTGSSQKRDRQSRTQMCRATLKPMRLRQVHRDAQVPEDLFFSSSSSSSSYSFSFSSSSSSSLAHEGNEAQPREWAARTLLEGFFPCFLNKGGGDPPYRPLEHVLSWLILFVETWERI